jgi:uncharacterized protein YndB with AHSA1/START domain
MTIHDEQGAVIDGDAYTVRRSILISASIEKVWAAVTQPDLISKWFTQSAVLDGAGVGATGFFTFSPTNSIPVRIEEIDPPHVIAYRWGNDDAAAAKDGGRRPETIDDEHSLVMRFTLEPTSDGVRLNLVETGFATTLDPMYNMEAHVRGWNQMFDQLGVYFGADA